MLLSFILHKDKRLYFIIDRLAVAKVVRKKTILTFSFFLRFQMNRSWLGWNSCCFWNRQLAIECFMLQLIHISCSINPHVMQYTRLMQNVHIISLLLKDWVVNHFKETGCNEGNFLKDRVCGVHNYPNYSLLDFISYLRSHVRVNL